jgi:hypothetical protein
MEHPVVSSTAAVIVAAFILGLVALAVQLRPWPHPRLSRWAAAACYVGAAELALSLFLNVQWFMVMLAIGVTTLVAHGLFLGRTPATTTADARSDLGNLASDLDSIADAILRWYAGREAAESELSMNRSLSFESRHEALVRFSNTTSDEFRRLYAAKAGAVLQRAAEAGFTPATVLGDTSIMGHALDLILAHGEPGPTTYMIGMTGHGIKRIAESVRDAEEEQSRHAKDLRRR